MRIAVWHNLGSGGAKRALYNHVKALKDHGHHLEAWTTDISSPDFLPLSDLIIENRKELRSSYQNLLKIKNPLKREQQIIKLLHAHCIECVKEIESKNFDLIFANSCKITYMPYIGRFTSIPKILYLGEPYRPLYEAMPENVWKAPYHKMKIKKIKRLFYDYRINYSRRLKVLNEIDAAKSYDKILVNSLFSRESVIRSYGTDATVCYLGIDTERFKPDGQKKEPFVIGLGSISFNKNVKKAIEIIGNIPKNCRPELKWIANMADQWYLAEILDFAHQLEVDFQYFLNISDEKLINLVSSASLMIYTSRLEPFGLAPLEANACGTYVVAISEGGIRESIKDGVNGSLIHGYKMKEFVEIIQKFIKNPEYAKAKGIEAMNYVNKEWNINFLSKNILNEVDDLYIKITVRYLL